MIREEDCEVELPSTTDDVNLRPNTSRDPSNMSHPTTFLLTLCVIREISKLIKITKPHVLSPAVIQDCDLRFNNCLATFPAHYQIQRSEPLDSRIIAPIMYLQNARLLLHRHNLTTQCAPQIRFAALNSCTSIAHNTARILSRCILDPPLSLDQQASTRHTWAAHLITASTALFCTHIWRCILFLCMQADFEAALVCVRVSAAIGDARPVNIACGRYVAFFLERLTEKMHHEGRANIEIDEELIAYVSGDLQGSLEHSWIWQGDESFREQEAQCSVLDIPERDDDTTEASKDIVLGRVDWNEILGRIERLSEEQQQEERQREVQGFSPRTPGGSLHLGSLTPDRGHTLPISSSRISIADIM